MSIRACRHGHQGIGAMGPSLGCLARQPPGCFAVRKKSCFVRCMPHTCTRSSCAASACVMWYWLAFGALLGRRKTFLVPRARTHTDTATRRRACRTHGRRRLDATVTKARTRSVLREALSLHASRLIACTNITYWHAACGPSAHYHTVSPYVYVT